jgi:PTH2 family peptidyl-tRNA hydrolase
LLDSRLQGLTDDCRAEFEFKQVIVVRRDLDMGKGKVAVQVAHAAVSASEDARKRFREWWDAWLNEGQCKVAVRVDSVDEILELERKSRELRLPSALITDRGLTQIEPGTITCLGIGPAPSALVDTLTGGLNLL